MNELNSSRIIIEKKRSEPRKPLLEIRKISISPEHGFGYCGKRQNFKWTKNEDTHLKHIVMDRIKRAKKDQFGACSSAIDDQNQFNENFLFEDSSNIKIDWNYVSKLLGTGRSESQCATRWLKVLSPSLVKGQWRPDEDQKIIEMVRIHGPRKWTLIASKLKGRIGKQCRERWHNHLDPSIDKSPWRFGEDQLIISLHSKYGNQWSKISKFLPGRTDNAIKNHWNCSLKMNKTRKSNRKAYTRKSKKEDVKSQTPIAISLIENEISNKVGSKSGQKNYRTRPDVCGKVLNNYSKHHDCDYDLKPTISEVIQKKNESVRIRGILTTDLKIHQLPTENLCVNKEFLADNFINENEFNRNTEHQQYLLNKNIINKMDIDDSDYECLNNLRYDGTIGREMLSGRMYKTISSPSLSETNRNANSLCSNGNWSISATSPRSRTTPPISACDHITTPTPLKRVFSEVERRQRQRSFGSPSSVLLEDVTEHILDESRISLKDPSNLSYADMNIMDGISEDLMTVETPSKALNSFLIGSDVSGNVNIGLEIGLVVDSDECESTDGEIKQSNSGSKKNRGTPSQNARKSLSGIFYDLG